MLKKKEVKPETAVGFTLYMLIVSHTSTKAVARFFVTEGRERGHYLTCLRKNPCRRGYILS